MASTNRTEISWKALSPEQKLERRLAAWLSPPGIRYATPQAEADYKARVSRFTDAIQLKQTPDRVPVSGRLGGFAANYCGYTEKDIMYDVDKAIDVATKCTLDFQFDERIAGSTPSGSVYDILDYRLYTWPGRGLAADGELQYNEGEYMKEDEYDALMDDPTDYFWRTYLPRIMGALEPLEKVPSAAYPTGNLVGVISSYGLPEVQVAFRKILEAGRESLNWQQKLTLANRRLEELGFPSLTGGGMHAPFDDIADMLRGTHGTIRDMFRQPKKLLKAVEWIAPRIVRRAVAAARLGSSPLVFFALHRGADGWMSDEMFKTFYWPSLREVIQGLIDEGLVPTLFCEGGYNSRLEAVRDLPKGKTLWYFVYTDMARAKEVLGDVACIMGNVPIVLLQTGTPEQTTAYCRQLIDVAGKRGGFILSTGGTMGRAGKADNIRAMIQCAKEYGAYA